MADEKPNGLYGRCDSCDHVFLIAKLPMPLLDVARLGTNAACPYCAGTKIFTATKEDLENA